MNPQACWETRGGGGQSLYPQPVFSCKLRYWLVEMVISTYPKPTIYRNFYENTDSVIKVFFQFTTENTLDSLPSAILIFHLLGIKSQLIFSSAMDRSLWGCYFHPDSDSGGEFRCRRSVWVTEVRAVESAICPVASNIYILTRQRVLTRSDKERRQSGVGAVQTLIKRTSHKTIRSYVTVTYQAIQQHMVRGASDLWWHFYN